MPERAGEIDVLIGTDCISEGQNLQDCDYLINYDIHWNPVRIIQRFGRIDRIGSTNASIQLVNFWPDISLDEYINLKERVENRMVIADLAATGDDNVLTAEANDVAYRKEQLRRLQDEVIELEDVKTGVSITDLGSTTSAWTCSTTSRSTATSPACPRACTPSSRPTRSGACSRRDLRAAEPQPGVNINQQNRLHPYYLVYLDDDGEVDRQPHRGQAACSICPRAACKDRDEPVLDVCRTLQRRDQGRPGHERLLRPARPGDPLDDRREGRARTSTACSPAEDDGADQHDQRASTTSS